MKCIKALMVVVTLLVAPLAQAEKIAVLGVQEALLSSKAAESFRASLQKELKAEQDQVIELEKQAKAMRDKLQKNGANMSQADQQQARLQFQKVFEEYQRKGQALQQKRMEREQDFINEMRPKLDEAIRGLIKDKGYDIVITKQAAVFAAKGYDITPQVIKLLNEK